MNSASWGPLMEDDGDDRDGVETALAFGNVWKDLWTAHLRQDPTLLALSDSRCIWKVDVVHLFRFGRACLSHTFKFPDTWSDGVHTNRRTCNIAVDFLVEASYGPGGSCKLEFWARKIAPQSTPYGGFNVALVAPTSADNDDDPKPDIRRSIWQETGLQWGWDALLKSKEEVGAYAPHGFLHFDIKWLHAHAAVDRCMSLSLCSYRITGVTHVVQPWYRCLTCKLGSAETDTLTDPFGCCEACAKICHKGHDVQFQRVTVCYCDCGAGTEDLASSSS